MSIFRRKHEEEEPPQEPPVRVTVVDFEEPPSFEWCYRFMWRMVWAAFWVSFPFLLLAFVIGIFSGAIR